VVPVFLEELAMRSPAILLALLLSSGLLGADDKTPKPIPPAEAAKKVNEKCTVEMKVKSTGKSRTLVFLNSEENYRDEKNFTVVLFEKGLEGLKKNKIEDPATHYKGKTVRVTGTVTLYNQKPQIKVEDPAQIEVVEKKDK
jgi:DNA/RNA endonuclease YhcR with UshA esterase domain